jgi:hypothetical protein
MRRFAAVAVLALLPACAPGRPSQEPGPLLRKPGVGVLTNTIRGRCSTILAGERLHRVCVPRVKAPSDSTRADTTDAQAAER